MTETGEGLQRKEYYMHSANRAITEEETVFEVTNVTFIRRTLSVGQNVCAHADLGLGHDSD